MNPCPCWSLRAGTIATAVFTFCYAILLIGLLGRATMVMSECSESFVDSDYDKCQHINDQCPCHDTMSVGAFQAIVNGALVIQIFCLVLLAVLFLSSGFTLLGVHTGARLWLWPYLVMAPLSILAILVFCILWWASHPKSYFIGITVVAFFIQPFAACGFLVTCIYYKELKKSELKPKYIVSGDQHHEYRRLIGHPGSEKSGDSPQNLRPGIIVYQDEGRASSRLMYARAHIMGAGDGSEDSYRNVNPEVRGYRPSPDRSYSYDKSQTPESKDSLRGAPNGDQPYRRGIENGRDSGSELANRNDDSSRSERTGSFPRQSGSGAGIHPELDEEPRPGTQQRLPQNDALSKFSTQPHFGSRAGDEAQPVDRHDSGSKSSDSESDTSLITHGRGKRKRSDSSRGGRVYKKRQGDGYHSEPENVKASPREAHYKRLGDSRRKKRGSDQRHPSGNEGQVVDHRFGRSKSSSELVNEGRNQGYGMQITIPHYVVIPPSSGQVRVNSEINLTIGQGTSRPLEPPAYHHQHGMIQHEEVIV